MRERSLRQPAKFSGNFIVSHRISIVAARVICPGDFTLAAFSHNLDTTWNFIRKLARELGVFLNLYFVDQLVYARIAQLLVRKKLVAERTMNQNCCDYVRQAVVSGFARGWAPLFPFLPGYFPCVLVGIQCYSLDVPGRNLPAQFQRRGDGGKCVRDREKTL